MALHNGSSKSTNRRNRDKLREEPKEKTAKLKKKCFS
jgi:hypothetical protein